MERGRILGIGFVFLFLLLAACALFAAQTAAQEVVVTHTETLLEHFNAGRFHHTGLTRMDDGEVQLLVVGIAGDWNTDTITTGLPALSNHTAVHHNGHILVLGGLGLGDTISKKVYYTTINPFTHDLADWQATADLPATQYPTGLHSHASVVVNDRVYVLGGVGYDDIPYDTVSFTRINDDGTLENAWQTTTAPLPVALELLQAAVLDGRIYVIGGRDNNSQLRAEVYSAKPDAATGDIVNWTPTTSFVHETYAHMTAAYSDTIYVMGGRHPDEEYSPYTNYAVPDADGNISNWVPATDMRHNLYGGAGLSFSGFLYTTGGARDGSLFPSDYVGTAMLNDDGTVGAWVDTSLIDPARFYHAVVCSDNGWLYVINGHDGSQPIRSINRGATAGAGVSYAPNGIFTSAVIDLGRKSKLRELRWNTTMEDPSATAITIQYRTRNYTTEEWSDWIGPYSSLATPGTVTTTQTLEGSARYVEYRVSFSTSEPSQTPILNAVQLLYVPPVYDVKIDKRGDPPSGSIVYPGDIVDYTLTYTCSTYSITATNAYLLDTVPDHMVYVPNSIQGPGANDSSAPLLRWELGTLAPGDSGQVSFSAMVADTYNEPVLLSNQGEVYSEDGPGRFSNVVTHEARLPIPELEVQKTASPPHGSHVAPGSQIIYTITYSNPSIFLAENAVLTDTYDLHGSYKVVSTMPEASDPSNSIWQLGDVAAGARGEVQVVVEVADGLPNHWIVSNQVDLGHNKMTHPVTDVVTHMVVYDGVALVDFSVDDIRWIPEEPGPDEEITFYATVTNRGAAAAGEYFWVSLYIKPQPSVPPLGAYDHIGGYCLDAACTTPRRHYLAYVPSLAPGASTELRFQGLEWDPVFPASGIYDVYVQADMSFDGDEYYPYWGRYPEEYEQNNVEHAVLVIPTPEGPPRLFLPVVTRLG